MEQALLQPPELVGPALLDVVEDQWFDRKSVRVEPRALATTLSALANAEGGVVVVGLSSGRVEGTDAAAKHRNRLVQAGRDHVVPPLRVATRLLPVLRDEDADHVLVLRVEPAEVVHATTDDEVHLRVGDSNRRLGFAERQELLYDKGQTTYESRPVPGTSLSDVDDGLLEAYRQAVGAQTGPGLLTARGLLVRGELTVAGLLLFGGEPQQHLPNAHVRVTRFLGRDRRVGQQQNVLADTRHEHPLPRLLRAVQDDVRALQPRRRALAGDGRFDDLPLIPEDVWLEAVVNALVHRSYSNIGDHVHVDVYDDRIEVESPGRVPGLVDVTDPTRTTRFARNPRVARVCADLRFGQEPGEGVRRMYEEMRLAGLPAPAYRQTSGSVRVSLSGEPVDRALDELLPVETRAVVQALREAGHLSSGELADVMRLGRPAALKRLNALRDAGVLRWTGRSPKDPRASWSLA